MIKTRIHVVDDRRDEDVDAYMVDDVFGAQPIKRPPLVINGKEHNNHWIRFIGGDDGNYWPEQRFDSVWIPHIIKALQAAYDELHGEPK